MTLKFKVTWKGAFFKKSYYISGCICAVGEISVILHIIEIRDHCDVTLRMMRDTHKWSTAQIQGQALFRLTLQISVCIRAIHAKNDKTCYKKMFMWCLMIRHWDSVPTSENLFRLDANAVFDLYKGGGVKPSLGVQSRESNQHSNVQSMGNSK